MEHTSTHSMPDACLFFINEQVLLNNKLNTLTLPYQKTIEALNLRVLSSHFADSVMLVQCKSYLPPAAMLEIGYSLNAVKPLLPELDTTCQQRLLKAYHWINWHKQSKYCGHCGELLVSDISKPEKKCGNCNSLFFPRFSPAVMVLIQKKNKILLARSAHFSPGVYSALAGFIEIGETAEENSQITISSIDFFIEKKSSDTNFNR